MTKLKIDYTNLNSRVIPNINSSLEALNNISNNVGDLNVPENFEYAEFLKTLPVEIESLHTNLKSKKDLLEQDINTYKKIESDNLNRYSSIRLYSMPFMKKI